MATYKIYKLHFTAPLHIGDQHEEEGISLKTIHSDTIYAALMSCLAKTGFEIPADGDLGFTVSSAFPYYQANDECAPVYFLPMPRQVRQPRLKDVSMAKQVKNVQWVDVAFYEKVLSGDSLFEGDSPCWQTLQGVYLTAQALPEDMQGSREFIRSEVSQRVSINNRMGEEDAVPYFVDKIVFRDASGLYFMAVGDTELLDRGLRILAQEGIGTDRHLGFGTFDYSTDTLTIATPADADHQMALSLLIPASEEQLQRLMASDRVAYDFMRRGGWITTWPYNTLRKNAIYAFLPGSVFCKTGDCAGKLVSLTPAIGELTPQHTIWRCGRALMLPIKLKQGI